MKPIALLLLLLSPLCHALAQRVAIQNDRSNVVYICVKNPLTVATVKYKAEELILTTDNGTIVPDVANGAGHYFFEPATTGSAKITVARKLSRKKTEFVSTFNCRVWKMPQMKAVFPDTRNGDISKTAICEQMELIAYAPGYNLDSTPVIQSFKVTVYEDTTAVFTRTVKGNKIDAETLNFFNKLEELDRVVFDDIKVKDCTGYTICSGVSFMITDTDGYRRQ